VLCRSTATAQRTRQVRGGTKLKIHPSSALFRSVTNHNCSLATRTSDARANLWPIGVNLQLIALALLCATPCQSRADLWLHEAPLELFNVREGCFFLVRRISPQWVVYREAVQTDSGLYMKDVTVIDGPEWLQELASHFSRNEMNWTRAPGVKFRSWHILCNPFSDAPVVFNTN